MTKKQELYFVSFLALIFILIGIGISYFGYYFYQKIAVLRKTGIKTSGILLRYERRKTSGSIPHNYVVVPIVKFKTLNNKEITFEGHINNTGLFQNLCYVGKPVEVIYDKNNPNNAVINTLAELWFMPILLWVIGFFFITIPPFTIYRAIQDKNLTFD